MEEKKESKVISSRRFTSKELKEMYEKVYPEAEIDEKGENTIFIYWR